MPRRSTRSSRSNSANDDNNNNEAAPRVLPAHVRQRQRAVAEREAARLARPEVRPTNTLGHADRKKSAVSSTPFGMLQTSSRSPQSVTASNSSTWCGPFTVAREMIAAREAAKRQREAELNKEEQDGTHHPLDAAMEALDEEKQKRLHPSLTWKSRIPRLSVEDEEDNDGGQKKSKKRLTVAMRRRQQQQEEQQRNKTLPSLYQLCVDFVVQNFEHVETLGDVDHSIRTTIAHELAGLNRLNADAFQALFVEPGIEALEMLDCADIPQETLCEALAHQLRPCLRYMALDQAGRCFGPKAVQTLLGLDGHKQQQPVQLFALSVGGAYLLTDADAARLLQTMAPTLQSLAFKACPMLHLQFCRSIRTSFQTEQNALLELALEDMTLDQKCLEALVAADDDDNDKDSTKARPWQRHLKSLTLKRITGLTDDIVVPLLQGAASTLEHLDLSGNIELTDACLGPLRTAAVDGDSTSSPLRSLQLAQLKQLSAIGLETLFTPALPGMGPPPQLKVLNLSHCYVNAITDQVCESALHAASRKRTTEEATNSSKNNNLSLLGGLVRLELQGSSISDTTLETVAGTCATSLEYLDVSFCPHISNQGLGYLVDQVGNQLESLNVWGCAQITDEFFNGHSRTILAEDVVKGGGSPGVVPLQITGAWIKKSGMTSIR